MATTIRPMIMKAHRAAVGLRGASGRQVQAALKALAELLETAEGPLLRANALDIAKLDPDDPRRDRLLLNGPRIAAIAASIRKVSRLPDPSGRLLERRVLANGLRVEKRAVPLGVVGAIYESRPNVTYDIAALCLRSRNGCLLKGSQEAAETNRVGIGLIRKALKAGGCRRTVWCCCRRSGR